MTRSSKKRIESWLDNRWRPMMGWSYMITCITDFIIFPILWSVLQSISQGQVTLQWDPITLRGAGLYHISMGAILGITAYGRSREKIQEIGGPYVPPYMPPYNSPQSYQQQQINTNPVPRSPVQPDQPEI